VAYRIEDYGMIGDCHTAALVSRYGSIDWLCLPHFDSPACFAALLGNEENGHWSIAPACEIEKIHRRYREGTAILETTYETSCGAVTLLDFMYPLDSSSDVLRLVVGQRGQVPMRMQLAIRFDYGSVVPWVRRTRHGISAFAGPDTVHLRTPVDLHGQNFQTHSHFTVSEGQRIPFHLAWHPSFRAEPPSLDVEKAITETEQWWCNWSCRCTYDGPWKEAVLRSLITLKALTFAPTGGIAAAVTTSLPEMLGGVRNWDYRFCWVRDASLSLQALMNAGYREEAHEWREWLIRAVAGKPTELNILYGLRGERRLTELELPWLSGYEDSKPVRIGNAAYTQVQLDVFGEVADTLFQSRQAGLADGGQGAARVARSLITHLEGSWDKPDDGIWEVRGPQRHFTHSKMMAWVAMDRAIRSAENGWLAGPVDKWREIRQRIHDQVCEKGFDSNLNSFVQFYGARHLDASLLMMPLVGFLPASDPRILGTVDAIEKHLLTRSGFVHRYTEDSEVDGIEHGEAAFLPCTFWLADNYALQGRMDDAKAVFQRLLDVRNDLGLLSEEYDPVDGRLLGNFPQAFSHFCMINTAYRLAGGSSPEPVNPAS
jgi:GH15 family glucan-1,4-alpha-glucosidase